MSDHHRTGRLDRLTVDEAKAAAEAHGLPEQVADLSIFQVLLRHPVMAKGVNDALGALLFRGTLDRRLRELMIMRIGWQTDSVYEWAQHWTLAQEWFGCDAADLVGVRDWRRHEAFGPPERAVLAAVDEGLADGAISEETWTALETHVGGTEELIEVSLVVGAWNMISIFLRSAQVPLEDGVEVWAPDGVGPR